MCNDAGFKRNAGLVWIAACAMLITTPIAIASASDRETYRFDFRNGQFDYEKLNSTGDHSSSRYLQLDPEGLKITKPARRDRVVGRVGFAPRFLIRGDFEATVQFKVALPTTEGDEQFVGPMVWLVAPSADDEAADISFRRRDGKGMVTGNVRRNVDGTRVSKGKTTPFDQIEGRFRVRRDGANLELLVAGIDEAEFTPVFSGEFTTADIELLRVTAETKDWKGSESVVWREIAIEADRLIDPATPRKSWLFSSLIGVGIALILGGGAWWLSRRRRS